MLLGSTLMPIAAGLMTTWQVDTTFPRLIIFPGFVGLACGIGFMGPQSGVQSTLPATDIPIGMAIVLFAQNFGPAFFTAIAQTIFTNRLAVELSSLMPGLSTQDIEQLGLTNLRSKFNKHDLDDALQSFDVSLMQTWYLAVGLTCMTMVGSLLMEWRSVKQKSS
jgi:hypothetical protein